MVKIWLLLLLLFFYLPQTGCYSKSQKDLIFKQKEPPQEEEASDSNTWDFGLVKEGQVLKHDFIFKNDSGKTVTIKNIDTSCGCTSSEVKKKTLLPGESTLIEVKFDTKGYAGGTKQHIYVYTDNIDNQIIRYIIKANVVK
jgi:hypothetical protein